MPPAEHSGEAQFSHLQKWVSNRVKRDAGQQVTIRTRQVLLKTCYYFYIILTVLIDMTCLYHLF